jgi:hypothetical protein
MKAFTGVAIFFSGLVVGHTLGVIYGVALQKSYDMKAV